jgi:propanol-preferring alcohol dehydrogenase
MFNSGCNKTPSTTAALTFSMKASSIPTTQIAAVIKNPGPDGTVHITNTHPVETPGKNQVLVKLAFSGIWYVTINVLLLLRLYPASLTLSSLSGSEVRALLGWSNYKPVVGHEGVGTVVQAGQDVPDSILGQRVGVKWLHSACGQCSHCKASSAHHCATPVFTGLHVQGTLQQYVVADARYLTKIPDGLPGEVAAPLLCAGLTMAGAIAELDRQQIPSNGWVVISGSGGGLGHIGVQMASRLRAYKVIAVDSGTSKRDLSLRCGAEAFIDFETENVEKRVKAITGEGAHACLIVSGSESAFELAPRLVRNAALLAVIGLPPATFNFPLAASALASKGTITLTLPLFTPVHQIVQVANRVSFPALTVTGVMVGSEQQMVDLLQHALAGVIDPVVQVEEFSQVPQVFEKLENNQVTGRIVVKIPE